MRTRALFASIAASAGILIGSWQLGAQSTPAPVAASSVGSQSAPTAAAPSAPSSGAGTTPSSGTAGTPSSGAQARTATGTYSGTTITNRYGSVMVQVTLSNGTITDVSAQMYANDGRSEQINSRAEPMLRSEVLAAQSAQVSMISGATYTSEAYLTSLQAALDQAGQ